MARRLSLYPPTRLFQEPVDLVEQVLLAPAHGVVGGCVQLEVAIGV